MANILRIVPIVTDVKDLESYFRNLNLFLTQNNSIAWKIIDKAQSTIADIGVKSHTLLTDIGVNTHVQIDSFIANKNNPTQVTKAQVGLGNVENTALSTWAGTANIITVGTLTGGSTGAGFTIALNLSAITGILGAVNGGTAQNTWTLGDVLYGNAANSLSKLAGNITTIRNFLRQTGNGLVSAAPVWDTLLASDVPTLNQNTTGSAATLTTPRAIYGNNFDGSANLAQVIASTYGGTGNGFTKFSGPLTSEKVFTLPNASSTLLYSGGALGTPSSGALTNCTSVPVSQAIQLLPLANLVLGAANTKLFTNPGATAAEWATGVYVGSFTRDVSTAAGTQIITGLPFKASLVIFIGTIGGGSTRTTFGFDDGINPNSIASIVVASVSFYANAGYSIYCGVAGVDDVKAKITSSDSSSFTLTWTNTGTGIFTFYYIALR